MPDQISPTPAIVDRDALIEQHRSYVRALAIKVLQTLPSAVELNDLIAYGDIGLVEAADRYDPRRGVGFPTFAHYRIKGAIYDGLREMGYYSRSANVRLRWTTQANDLLRSAADDEQASAESAAASVDDEIASTQSLIDTLIPVYLLSLGSDAVPELVDYNALSMEKIEQRELIGIVLRVLSELSEDEQQLVDALYFKHVSMTELAARMGITKSWISRLHARAIKHLRESLRDRGILGD
ncbi:MAG TPA: sigma-70 family RNA polymerase sigma factor [Pyrinomonadaceae bacterium]|jgi:RNA polymerase sigma factor for flagellar operon FliA|nr:sigma-70 family RNA polymerase sigma factor [Pyrinomonadaceae bacterium]